MDEASRQDATLAAAEAPLHQYFATDDESSSDDDDFVPASEPVFRVRRAHDDEAGGSSLPGQREAESPIPPQITTAQVTQPDQLTSLIKTLAAQTQATLQVQQQMQAQFQQHQETQQVILEGIRQQQEAQRKQMLQHQMMTTQMFTFMSGCLGQLFQQSGLQLP
jgi:DNA-binding transcriptional regulator YbjK